MDQKAKAAMLSIVSNTALIIIKFAVGVIMRSVSVISEAVHSGIDLMAAIVAYFSVREAGKPADDEHHFGHGKIENVSGTIEAVLIFAAAVYIIVESVKKLLSGHIAIEALGAGAAVMGISAAVNLLISNHLLTVARKTDSMALEADALHLRTDVYTSAGVLAGLVAIQVTGFKSLDPLIAIGVALLIIKAAFELTKIAFVNILDARLPVEEEKVIRRVLNSFSGEYVEYHKLRTRKSGAERHIDMHLVVPKSRSVEISHRLSHEIADKIAEFMPHCQILVHVEPCDGKCDACGKECKER